MSFLVAYTSLARTAPDHGKGKGKGKGKTMGRNARRNSEAQVSRIQMRLDRYTSRSSGIRRPSFLSVICIELQSRLMDTDDGDSKTRRIRQQFELGVDPSVGKGAELYSTVVFHWEVYTKSLESAKKDNVKRSLRYMIHLNCPNHLKGNHCKHNFLIHESTLQLFFQSLPSLPSKLAVNPLLYTSNVHLLDFVHNYEALVLIQESLKIERKTGQEYLHRRKISKIKKLPAGSPKQREELGKSFRSVLRGKIRLGVNYTASREGEGFININILEKAAMIRVCGGRGRHLAETSVHNGLG
ncbi:hypothetical protein K435DRAFT_802116 [Dendrothele bispora CBS 962.96]|uniref:Uncharacterized protein n=1 Tax=Dendrothele bispora (strain CBS 962.96) TaxID=1314807 RepID=A0A4V4HEA0_DENBC|nr:hypothetical protein K435DRAFT_802116 [Dendrothele bispora CBS 962.96]